MSISTVSDFVSLSPSLSDDSSLLETTSDAKEEQSLRGESNAEVTLSPSIVMAPAWNNRVVMN